MNKFKSSFIVVLALTSLLVSSSQTLAAEDDHKSESSVLGPSIHLALGIRSKKAPDLDTYYSTVGGVKLSPFGIKAGPSLYLQFLAPGLYYAGYGVFAPTVSPIIFYSNVGLGFAFDFFPVRQDRAGGPIGMSLNLDVVRIAQFVSGL